MPLQPGYSETWKKTVVQETGDKLLEPASRTLRKGESYIAQWRKGAGEQRHLLSQCYSVEPLNR